MTDPDAEHVFDDAEAEIVDALPVPEGPTWQPPAPAPSRGALVAVGPMAVQAAAVAVTGFAAGAAAVAVVRRHRARKARRDIKASRSFLVDVHLLNRN